jgi:hypothetical protein
MRRQGLTKDILIKARDLYKAQSKAIVKNKVAAERLKLVEKILRNW